MKKLTPYEANFCEQPIIEKEILSSLKNLHNQKTNRFPVDFYKYFWIDIKNLLTDSIYMQLTLVNSQYVCFFVCFSFLYSGR